MWRYLAGGVAALLLVAAGILLFKSPARSDSPLPAARAALASQAGEGLPDTVPEATAKTREEKRFSRYDKDRNAQITREEYLAARRKAFAKLDTNADGKLSFEELAVKATTKFADADKDKSGAMNATEFSTTAVKRNPQRAKVPCPPVAAKAGEDES